MACPERIRWRYFFKIIYIYATRIKSDIGAIAAYLSGGPVQLRRCTVIIYKSITHTHNVSCPARLRGKESELVRSLPCPRVRRGT